LVLTGGTRINVIEGGRKKEKEILLLKETKYNQEGVGQRWGSGDRKDVREKRNFEGATP